MIFGKGPFVCDECGEKFTSIYAELMATCIIAPQRCLACGSWHTCPPATICGKEVYKKIRKSMDKNTLYYGTEE